ncbi:MAG: hypothetical protein D6803_08005 [Anaerolineae bacterium]|nr:MAG: hypothetical protein D6803_08005 [Anaerolineae bacterium]
MCDALSYMHNQNPPVLHRDIKPGNVRIAPDGTIYLVDFGLAKVAFSGHRTTTGARAMTPGYSPPEQYGGARTDQRSDIYSLAATLYAALAGTIPEDSLARTMGQEELTPLRQHNPAVSRRFARVIEKALEVHPENRYQTAEEFKQALLETTSGERFRRVKEGMKAEGEVPSAVVQQRSGKPLPASAPLDDQSPAPPSRPKPRRWGCLAWLLSGVLLLIAVAGGVYLLFPGQAREGLDAVARSFPALRAWLPASDFTPTATVVVAVAEIPTQTDTARPTATVATPTATRTSTQRPSATASATMSPSATMTPSVTSSWTPDWTATAAVVLADTPTSAPTSTPFPSETPFVSPTPVITFTPSVTPFGGGYGQIAFASDRSGIPQIWVMNTDGSGLRQLTDLHLGACQPDWSPDGMRIVFISPCEKNQELYPGAGLFVMNADGSDVQSLPAVGAGAFDPDWSPDGKRIVYTSLKRAEHPQLYVLDLESGESTLLSNPEYWDAQARWSPDGSVIAFVTTRNGPYQIWIMNPDGSEQHRFSASGGLWDQYPIWSPDGQVIYFTQREPGGVPRLMGARYPDGGAAEFSVYPFPGNVPMKELSISPDGLWFLFESWKAGEQHDIYLLQPGKQEIVPITDELGWEFDVAWRPAGP